MQKASSKTRETGWYNFNNRKRFMTGIYYKSKLKNWNYNFLFVHRATYWADIPN